MRNVNGGLKCTAKIGAALPNGKRPVTHPANPWTYWPMQRPEGWTYWRTNAGG